jgi:hypothetical protein
VKRKSESHPKKKIVIDAEGGGNITRVLDHSYNPKCEASSTKCGTEPVKRSLWLHFRRCFLVMKSL